MQLSRLVDVSRQVAATRGRLRKRTLLAQCLREAAGDAAIVVSYLAGVLPQGRIGVGWKVVSGLAGEAPAGGGPGLTVAEVDAVFERLAATAGRGSQRVRRELLGRLFERCDAAEREFLSRLMLGELRQGALEGTLVDAIAEASTCLRRRYGGP